MINLQDFCGDEGSNFRLATPFSKGEWSYATNGHIVIRVPLIDGLGEDGPNADKMFEVYCKNIAAPSITLTVELPPLETQSEDCSECDGTGNPHDCPACECKCDGSRLMGRFLRQERERGDRRRAVRLRTCSLTHDASGVADRATTAKEGAVLRVRWWRRVTDAADETARDEHRSDDMTTDDSLLLSDLDRIAEVITESIDVLDDDARKLRPDETMLLHGLFRAEREMVTLRERLERRLKA